MSHDMEMNLYAESGRNYSKEKLILNLTQTDKQTSRHSNRMQI